MNLESKLTLQYSFLKYFIDRHKDRLRKPIYETQLINISNIQQKIS